MQIGGHRPGYRLAGRADAFNPAELLLAELSACIIKGIERVTPILKFSLRGVEVRVEGVRQNVPPKIVQKFRQSMMTKGVKEFALF